MLTETELEILKWLAEGKNQSDISTIRGVSIRTTHVQLYGVRKKLGASNAAHCVAIAMRQGLIK